MTKRGVDLVVRALMAEGVDTIFTLAGDHVLPLMDNMVDQGFRFVDTRHEQAAVDMANAWSRVTGRPGVTMFTTPGLANAIAGLTFARHLESPVINIVGSAAQDRLGLGASQEIDQVGMARPVTKGAWMISDARRIPDMFAQAFRTALSGRRGPVHMTIPLDVQMAEVDGDVWSYEATQYRDTGVMQGDPSRVKEAADLLQAAERPVIIAGNGAYSVTGGELSRLVEVTGIPLFTEEAARGVVPDNHPLCFGMADGRVTPVARFQAEADVLLLLGKKIDFTMDFGEPPAVKADVKIVQVEPSADLIGLSRGVDVAVQGDVGAVVRQLADECDGRSWARHPMLGPLESAQAAFHSSLEKKATGPDVHSMAVHKAMLSLLEEEDALVFEGSDFGFYGAAYYPSLKGKRWFTNGTLGMLGWGVSFGIGAQVALPNSRVIVFAGDGAFGFNGMEIDTAVRHNIPVTVIVGNDAVWGIDYHQQVDLYGRTVATELLPVRYDRVAEALGAHGEYVEEASQLQGAIERALTSGGPSVVNVRTVPSPSPLTEYIIDLKGG